MQRGHSIQFSWRPTALLAAALVTCASLSPAASAGPTLQQIGAIDLGNVVGRIDHLAVDVADGLLFVSELGNDSVSVVDLATGSVRQRIFNLPRAQGLAYVAQTHTLYVATGIDGLLRSYAVPDMALVTTTEIGVDADNVHADPSGRFVAVGFSNGVALIDTTTGDLIRSVALSGHVEGFQFDASGGRIIANIPDTGEIAAIDTGDGTVTTWPTGQLGANFPLAIDAGNVLAGFRAPAGLRVYGLENGLPVADIPLCSDNDDLAVDPVAGRVYAVCGSGEVMTFVRVAGEETYRLIGETPTLPGARTGLFVPELDRLFVAAPARNGEGAAILVFAPSG